jgi:hypothetical protein
MSKIFTQAEFASHNKPDNLYIAVDHDVYDMTTFQEEHPGGKKSQPMSLPSCLRLHSNPLNSHPTGRRQGRVKAVLEIPQ